MSKKKDNSFFGYLKSNLLFIAMVMLVFTFSVSYMVTESSSRKLKPVEVGNSEDLVLSDEDEDFPDVPVLQVSGESNIPLVTAQGVLAADVDSGVLLYEKNPDAQYLPASTVKIISALVASEVFQFEEVLTVKNPSVEGQKMRLVIGEEITVENLMYGLLVYSANDAAEVLAQNYPGGREVFIEAMNEKADELGLENTVFSTPTGLDGNGQVTSAKDLVTVSKYAMNLPWFSRIVELKEKRVESIDGKYVHNLKSTNELLDEIDGVKGVKTGWTENARENLVTFVERDDKKVLVVVLGSQDRFSETKTLIEWIFKNYNWQEVGNF